MEKSAQHSARLTNTLFWYGVLSGLLAAIVSFAPGVISEIISFILNAINFITILIGSVLAYAYFKHAEAPLFSHYQYLIRTLWLMVGFSLILMIFSVKDALDYLSSALNMGLQQSTEPHNYFIANIDKLVNLIGNIWFFARVYKARQSLDKNEAISHFKTWLI